jgi:tetratricopeptide (TPR) repeat protein
MALLLVVAAFVALREPAEPPSGPAAARATLPSPAYVGGAACASCHRKEHDAWAGSHHDRAMAAANDATVLGDFSNATFAYAGITSTFFRRDGRFFVRTDGPDGRLADFEIVYTFGVTPLQQYLVALPGGRLQALGIAWDSRAAKDGGQRWFHLYPGRKLKAGDPLHWTGIDQTWNYQCADCHSTNLRKNYDEKTGTYATTWTDVNVTCEACHGPGSAHVDWARRREASAQGPAAGDPAGLADPAKGLTVVLDERRGVQWTIDPATGNATRSAPRTGAKEIETCARCHARRGQFSDAWHAGQRLADGYRAALLEPGLYFDDGQQRDEVFNFGSFLGSRMHAQGVTCSDCHDPHTAKTRLPGNAVCAPCHQSGKYDTPSHHHHGSGSQEGAGPPQAAAPPAGGRPGETGPQGRLQGTECAACHMPTTTYMVVDPRHDHSFRIPRPDRTLSLGIPNACNACHADKKAEWAVAAVKAWYPQPRPGFQSFAEAFARAERGAPGGLQALAAVAADRSLGGLVRASAIRRIGTGIGPETLPALQAAVGDADPLVRAAAAGVLLMASAELRGGLLPPLLADPVREVRMAAARALAGDTEAGLSPGDRARFDVALAEYVAAERFNADRPEGRANLGNLHATRARYGDAEAAFRAALALDSTFVQAALNLADLQRTLGQEAQAEQTLRAAIARNPRAAPAHLALGLSLARQQRRDEALKSLAEAARLDPASPRAAFVHAVALHDAGQGARARRELEAALQRHPYDQDLLLTMALYERDAGQRGRALEFARRLLEVAPGSPEAAQLARELQGSGR